MGINHPDNFPGKPWPRGLRRRYAATPAGCIMTARQSCVAAMYRVAQGLPGAFAMYP